MLIMRACSQIREILFAIDVWSRHVTGKENALRDQTKSKTTVAQESTAPVRAMQFFKFCLQLFKTSDNRPRNTCV